MDVRDGFACTVGNTPLIKLRRASEETGCTILGKAEFLNPGGSVKDRAALYIIKDAEEKGLLKPGGVIVEGTAGNTGIGLALVGNARGYRTVIVMPETQTQEKKDMLRLCGVDLRLVPAVPYANPMHYARYSGRLAEEIAAEEPNGAIWANQFGNLANRRGHYETTGPEIWRQTDGKVDGFICSAGTGGTLSGVGIALKERNPKVKVYLADPMGSGFFSWYARHEWKPEGNSITEGIGNNYETGNIAGFAPDGQYQITDAEMLPVLFDLVTERAGARRLDRDQCLRRDPSGEGIGAGQNNRNDPSRFRHALSVEAVQPCLSQGKKPPHPAVAVVRWMLQHRCPRGARDEEARLPAGRRVHRRAVQGQPCRGRARRRRGVERRDAIDCGLDQPV
jgi:cysteine synthase A